MEADIETGGNQNVKVSHNFISRNISEANFNNPDANDYSLRADSPAIDGGTNVDGSGITTDHVGGLRPQGSSVDIGAFEFGSGALPPSLPPTLLPPTPSPTPTPTPSPTPQPADTSLEIEPAENDAQPGDTLDVRLTIRDASSLYGLQLNCTVDPAVLQFQEIRFGDFFDDPLVGFNQINPAAGTWFGAITQKNPAPPVSGDGLVATLSFNVVAPGDMSVFCQPLAANRDGFELPISASGDPDPGSLWGIKGNAKYPGRFDHSGITIIAERPIERRVLTNGSGHFEINGLESGEYFLRVDARMHLPSCAAVTVSEDQMTSLVSVTLTGGDINDDGAVDIDDAALLGGNFGLSASTIPLMDVRADINADGSVNVQDLSILSSNFGKADCQEWQAVAPPPSPTPMPTDTPTPVPPTATATPKPPTNTPKPPTATPPATPVPPTRTPTPILATNTATPKPPSTTPAATVMTPAGTPTLEPSTNTPTATPQPPTATPVPPTQTATTLPPTNTPTAPATIPTDTPTPEPPTATPTPMPPTATPTNTPSPEPPTATSTPQSPTDTPTATATPD